MFVLIASAVLAATPVQVSVNDKPLAASAIVRNGRALLPFRSIFSALGAAVSYQAAGHRVFAHRGSDSLTLRIGSATATLNGFPVKLDVTPQIAGERLYVPVRFVAQALGARVQYDAVDRIVFVRDIRAVVAVHMPAKPSTLDTPAPTFPTSPPVPYVVNSQSYPSYNSFSFSIPSAYDERVFYPGQRLRFVLTGPPGGTAFMRVCGYGDLPFVNPLGTNEYFTTFVVPDRFRNRSCNVVAYYTGALGARQTIELSHDLYFAAPTPAPTPTPRPTERPTPSPTASPAVRRSTEPVFRRTPPPA